MKIICIDSFKLSYLKHSPFLSSLIKNYQYGELKVPVGFWGGMETFSKGKSDILAFYYYSNNSSLRWTMYFRFLRKFLLNVIINFSRLLKGEQLFYTCEIPLNKLYLFDTAIKKKLNFGDYLHIGELDSIAHRYGTEAKETIKCIKKIDKRLSKMDFDVVMSDHGMVDVKEIISVPITDNCFIDSTMVRYWGKCPKLPKGRFLKVDKKWGDYVFLVKPGVLISPNFWSKYPVKAMHGYEKKCNGFYILKKKGKKKNLDMKQLHDLVFI